MTRIEKVVRDVSDLRDFYLRISKEKKQAAGKSKSLFSENQPPKHDITSISQDSKPPLDRNK
jgi:hypothetical protein